MTPVEEIEGHGMNESQAAEARQRAGQERSARLAADEPPGGQARAVCTQWQVRSRDARTGVVTTTPPRLRAEKRERDGKQFYVVEGYATVYERGYEMWDMFGPYTEIVSNGAAEQTLGADPDVVFLVNHRGLAMARTVANTLDLWSDDTGMGDRAWLNPQRQDVRDLVLGIEDGTITEQSFAFMITAGRWSPDYTEYRIDVYDINRGDASAVNYGANPYTSIAARGREMLDELDKLPAGMARAAFDRLSTRTDLGMVPARSAEPPATIPADAAPAPDRLTGRSVTALDAWLAATAVR
jgi:HK97 family phage prohead protease